MRPAELPVISLTAESAAAVRAARWVQFAPAIPTVNGRTVILQGWAPRMSGDLGSVFLTHDGTWWRVETRLETFEKRRKRDPAQAAFLRMVVACSD